MKTTSPFGSFRRIRFFLFFLCLSLFCVFGGRRYDSAAAGIKPTAKQAGVTVSTNPSMSGRWELNPRTGGVIFDWSRANVPIHASVLPDGRVLFWGRDKQEATDPATGNPIVEDVKGKAMAHVWSPHYGDDPDGFIQVDNSRTNLFCSGHSFLQDGRLLVTGGQGDLLFPNKSVDSEGSPHINIFNYRDNTWTAGPTMSAGRWYPYNVTRDNGEVFIVSGVRKFTTPAGNTTGTAVKTPIIFDLNGNLRAFSPTQSQDSNQTSTANYPKVHLAPNGNVFLGAALDADTASRFFNFSSNKWEAIVSDPADQLGNGFRDLATSALYEQGKVLMLGGRGTRNINGSDVTDAPMNRIKTMDLNVSPLKWTTETAPGGGEVTMNFNRIYHTTTLLPDGKVLVTGGTQCPGVIRLNCTDAVVRHPELWDPATKTFTVMAPASATPRVYHSVALLLPDARVLVGGGGRPLADDEVSRSDPQRPDQHELHNGAHKDVEIFSPPYLFDPNGSPVARRPAITFAPEKAVYNQQFTVGVGGFKGTDIEDVVLVSLPSVTHQFNPNQRRVVLQVDKDNAKEYSLKVTAPVDGLQCPPGPYMMFLLTKNGAQLLPSKARIIIVGDIALDRPLQPAGTDGEPKLLNSSGQTFTAELNEVNTNPDLLKIVVRTRPTLDWTAQVTTSSPWLHLGLIEKNPSTGEGAINFTVDRNVAADPNTPLPQRSATIKVTVGGKSLVWQEFKVSQAKQFIDMPPTNPFYPFVSKLSALGITGGCNGGKQFCGGDPITREAMAVFLIEAIGASPRRPINQPLTVDPFQDVPFNSPFAVHIKEMAMRGISAGCGIDPMTKASLFCPKNMVDRGAMAVFLCSVMGISNPPDVRDNEVLFSDIPKTHPLARFIYELKHRGIVAGFTDGKYHPESSVTREQMAVFLSTAFNL